MRETGDSTTDLRPGEATRSSRAVAGLPVRIFAGQERMIGIVQDFSCSGMFVRTDCALLKGTGCQVHLVLPEKGELVLDCQVVRTEVEGRHDAGLGLCFAELQEEVDTARMEQLGQLLVDVRALAIALHDLKPGASLRGNLRTTPLACVLSCVDADGTSGSLRVDHRELRGVIPLAEGRLLDFASDAPTTRSSEQSIDHLLRCGSSDFVLNKILGTRHEPHSGRVLDILWRHMHAVNSL